MRFLLIDKITKWQIGQCAEAKKNVALSEDFFDDHFPRKPIMPGVLIVEGMAQLAGILLEESAKSMQGLKIKALMSIVDKMKFRNPAYPGDTLLYRADIMQINELGGKTTVRACIGDDVLAEGALTFSFHEFSDPQLDEQRAQTLALWLAGVEQ